MHLRSIPRARPASQEAGAGSAISIRRIRRTRRCARGARVVRAWWTNKAAEIHALIPDFGGFLVKADSEGMPGPLYYKRTHVDGANMLADALAPIGGTVIWRAFVYGTKGDRAMDAYHAFKPHDGKFRDNVFLQIKNGPLDFQPREPFTPLFGAMPNTDLHHHPACRQSDAVPAVDPGAL